MNGEADNQLTSRKLRGMVYATQRLKYEKQTARLLIFSLLLQIATLLFLLITLFHPYAV